MSFRPREILFLPSTWCNLKCAHCAPPQVRKTLSKDAAIRFLRDCKRNKITKVGFTGGEIFLHPDFLLPVVRKARALDFVFTFITTNGVWFKDRKDLKEKLHKLHDAGYDGSFFVSVDTFHHSNLKKIAMFIQEAVRLWQRPDIVSLAYVWGVHQAKTKSKIYTLARLLRMKVKPSLEDGTCCLVSGDYVIRTFRVPFSAARGKEWIRNPWGDAEWFVEDHCRGPGNVLFILPDGTVRPCCGYGSHSGQLTIGSIHRDSVKILLNKAKNNSLLQAIFKKGLTFLRKQLHTGGVVFPGKTKDQCYLCEYILKRYPDKLRS